MQSYELADMIRLMSENHQFEIHSFPHFLCGRLCGCSNGVNSPGGAGFKVNGVRFNGFLVNQ